MVLNVNTKPITLSYRAFFTVTVAVLIFGLVIWYGNLKLRQRKDDEKVMNAASKISLSDISDRHLWQMAKSIIGNLFHPPIINLNCCLFGTRCIRHKHCVRVCAIKAFNCRD